MMNIHRVCLEGVSRMISSDWIKLSTFLHETINYGKIKKKVPFFPSLFYLLGFVLQFLFLILFFLKKWISSKKSGFLSLLLKIFPYKIMANFLPHELTDKNFFFIIDARKLLVYVSHNYKNLVFGDNYFHNS